MNYYKGIYVFNLVLPALACLGIIALIGKVKGDLDQKYEKRSLAFQEKKQLNQRIDSVKVETSQYIRNHSTSWNDLLTAESSVQITQTLNAILNEIPSTNLQQTSFTVNPQKLRFASEIQQESASVTLGFRGRYAIMQKVLVELETKLPHFLLESLSITPASTNDDTLDFLFNYVVWKK